MIFECNSNLKAIKFSQEKIMEQDNNPQTENNQAKGPAITINSQYIKDFSLEIPHAPEIFLEVKGNPDVSINVDVSARNLKDNFYNVDLVFAINGDVNGKKFFILELTYAGVVELNIPQEHIEPVLMIEIPRMLFPFARQIITTSLTEAGLPPFMINPIDFVQMYQARKNANKQ